MVGKARPLILLPPSLLVVSSLTHLHLSHYPLGNVHSQVTVTGPEEEDQGHQVPALTENPEPMEEQAKGEED